MTHIEIEIEEYEIEYCDNCNHRTSLHYNSPKDVFDYDGKYIYTAEGCMVISGERKLKGENPYKRCECLRSV